MTRIPERYGQAVELLDRVGTVLRAVVGNLEDDCTGQPGGSHYDPISRSNVSTVLFCPAHEQDLDDCHRDELTCDRGIPVPVHSDPTGEAAVADDRARYRLKDLESHVKALHTEAVWLESFVHDNADPPPRAANPVERRATEAENRRKGPLCEVCARSGAKVDAIVVASNPGGALPRPHTCCRWHHDFVTDHLRLPTQEEERLHQQGKRVVVRTVQTDRLRRGLKTGSLT